jgi:hypothetical protein
MASAAFLVAKTYQPTVNGLETMENLVPVAIWLQTPGFSGSGGYGGGAIIL